MDVLIVGRGGGSTEDLWAFNTEEVARAIRGSSIPVISAVGHETDFTIADFVSDYRAATPSAAAEIVATREDQLCSALDQMGRQLLRLTKFRIVDARSRVQEHALSQVFDEVKTKLHDARVDANSATHQLQVSVNRLLRQATLMSNVLAQKISPAQLQTRVTTARARYDAAASSCSGAMSERLQSGKERLGLAAASLDALSPLAVLHRGYAIAQDAGGKLLRDTANVTVGDRVDVLLSKGKLKTKVEDIQ